jgi:GGDEF domain-containing protein
MNDKTIKARISIGLTSCDPSKMHMDKRKIIHLSDSALLKAKECGKNKICALFPNG